MYMGGLARGAKHLSRARIFLSSWGFLFIINASMKHVVIFPRGINPGPRGRWSPVHVWVFTHRMLADVRGFLLCRTHTLDLRAASLPV